MTRQTLAVIGGDGIGPEVTAEALKVLRAAVGENAFEEVHFDLGAERWLRTGEVLPDSTLEDLRATDAILLGAVGAAPGSDRIPSGLLERGLLLRLRFAFDHAVNLRPSRLYAGVSTPLSPEVVARGDIDFVVVREGTEGLYCGNGGAVRAGTPQEIATEVSVNTAFGVERVVRDAFARARARRGRITLLHKHNVLVNAGGLWRRLFDQIGEEFPDVARDYLHIDAAMIAMVVDPAQFDVIVTGNMFGDILSDAASMLTGSIGMLPSASLNASGFGMYEPIHGSAPDIAGTNKANPLATILSLAMLLRYSLNDEARAQQVENAVQKVLQQGLRTGDIYEEGTKLVSCSEMGDAVLAAL